MEEPARPGERPDPASTPVSAPPLQRSAENRVIGGVCGGIAEYTDIDPIVYRVLAAVLTLVGGAGLILYGAAMLLVPDARTGTAPLARLFGGSRPSRTAGVLLAVVAVLVVVGALTNVFGGASFSIVVITALAVLVAHRRGVNFRELLRGHPAPAPPGSPQQVPEYAPAPGPVPGVASVPADSTQEQTRRMSAPSVPAYDRPYQHPQGQPPGDAPTMRMPVPPPQPPLPPPQQQPPQQPPTGYVDFATMGGRPPSRPAKAKLPSITGWVWLLAALAGGGLAWLQHTGVAPGDVRVPLAVALAVLGLGLTVSTWVGRAGVKAWGVLLTIALGVATVAVGPAATIRWDPVTWTPASATQLAAQQPYDVGVGAATLDLSGLELRNRHTYPAKVTMTAGRLVVLVPKSAAVDLSVRCERCAGDALGHSLDGTNVTVNDRVEPGGGGTEIMAPEKSRRPTADAPVVDLDVTVEAGEVEVRRAA